MKGGWSGWAERKEKKEVNNTKHNFIAAAAAAFSHNFTQLPGFFIISNHLTSHKDRGGEKELCICKVMGKGVNNSNS